MAQPRNPFTRTGALGLDHPLFRGRSSELARLEHACVSELDFFLLVYGGRQNGKTSVLVRLEATLRARFAEGVRVCRIDFQGMPRATSMQVYRHMAQRIAAVLPQAPQPPDAPDAPALSAFLAQGLRNAEVTRLIVLLDELGILPDTTREDLAHVLRSLHTSRLEHPALANVQFVLAGGIELYNLAVVEASALRNVCEIVRLGDLSETDAITLIADGLPIAGVAAEQARALGNSIYARVHGHPYLTQRIGSRLADQHLAGEAIDDDAVDRVCWSLIEGDNPLLDHLRRAIGERQLLDAARHLLSGNHRTSRTDDATARLELLGVAQRAQSRWQPRNALIRVALAEWLGMYVPEGVSLLEAAEHVQQRAISDHLDDLKREQEATAQRAPLASTVNEQIRLQRRASELADEIKRLEAAQQIITPPVPQQVASAPAPPVVAPARREQPRPLQPNWVPELIKIPAGPFLMGSSDADPLADSDEKPQHRPDLPDYWIGKTPVTNAQFRPFIEGDGYRNKRYWTEAGWKWREEGKILRPDYWDNAKWNSDLFPVVGISWFEAVAYCRWLSAQTGQAFRLPSEAEWEKAARGPGGFIWPWGNDWQADRCNSKEAGKQATTPVDAYPQGASPYGVLDMSGNVREWCATVWRQKYPYTLANEWQNAYLEPDKSRMLRGGAWYSEQKNVRGACRDHHHFPRYRLDNIGLRVASHSLRTDTDS